MPDLSPLREHERELERLEEQLQADLSRRYAQLREQLLGILDRRGPSGLWSALAGAIAEAREDMQILISNAATEVEALAINYAAQEAGAIGVEPPRVPDLTDQLDPIQDALRGQALAWLDGVEAQLLASASLAMVQQHDEALIRSRLLAQDLDGGRASIWRSGESGLSLGSTGLIWTLASAAREVSYRAAAQRTKKRIQKQAIAALDERTTDCCLKVHGQIRPLDKPFDLTGFPRFADQMMSPAFHYNCRTSSVLYAEELESVGSSTREMRAAADAELAARERTQQRAEIHPADATSRRS